MSTKPSWLKVRLPGGPLYVQVKSILKQYRLTTVCEHARCPNLGECWRSGTATFMLMGETCTRHCRFCAVSSGHPAGPPDEKEPRRLAQAVLALKLKYVVLTSVTRDDLPDQGASHFAASIRAIRQQAPQARIECLIPDFNRSALMQLCAQPPDVLAHNVEVVARLTPLSRDPRCQYQRSLQVLANTRELMPQLLTKSSLMLGLGETHDEICQTLQDLRQVGVSLLTIGQYLQPSQQNLAVHTYISPQMFANYAQLARAMGFVGVAAGPLVRSSYQAAAMYHKIKSLIHSQQEADSV